MITGKSKKLQPGENQHIRLKLDQVKLHYQDGLITAAGLLYYAIGIMRPPGKDLTLTVAQWLELTSLKERTFYKAKAKLVAQGKLAEKVEGFITLKYESFVIDLSEKQQEKGADTTQSSDCPIVQLSCPNGQSERPIVQGNCPNGQSERPIVRSEPPKPLVNKSFGDSPDITDKADKAAPQSAALSACQNEEKETNVSDLESKENSIGVAIANCYEEMLAQAESELSRTEKISKRQAIAKNISVLKDRLARAKSKKQLSLKSHFLYSTYSFEGQDWESAARRFGHSEDAIADFKELLNSCT